jgi:hypothetical protein
METTETMTTGEMWRAVASATYSEMWHAVQDAAREIITYATDEHGTIDTDKAEDSVHDYADGLIPVYYGEQVREWLALGLPDCDDSSGGVWGDIVGALYEWYSVELSRVVSEMLGEVA